MIRAAPSSTPSAQAPRGNEPAQPPMIDTPPTESAIRERVRRSQAEEQTFGIPAGVVRESRAERNADRDEHRRFTQDNRNGRAANADRRAPDSRPIRAGATLRDGPGGSSRLPETSDERARISRGERGEVASRYRASSLTRSCGRREGALSGSGRVPRRLLSCNTPREELHVVLPARGDRRVRRCLHLRPRRTAVDQSRASVADRQQPGRRRWSARELGAPVVHSGHRCLSHGVAPRFGRTAGPPIAAARGRHDRWRLRRGGRRHERHAVGRRGVTPKVRNRIARSRLIVHGRLARPVAAAVRPERRPTA